MIPLVGYSILIQQQQQSNRSSLKMKTTENKRTTGKEPLRFVIAIGKDLPIDCNAVN